MLSNVIKNAIAADTGIGLTDTVDLFAESAAGDQYALVRTFSPKPWAPELYENRDATVQVLLKGYTYNDGYALAEKIARRVTRSAGEHIYRTETYKILSIILKQAPFAYKDSSGVLYFSVNFHIFYILTMA